MSELLTTGQMIDQLKIGESAVCELETHTLEVYKTADGKIRHKDFSEGHLVLSFDTDHKWKIVSPFNAYKITGINKNGTMYMRVETASGNYTASSNAVVGAIEMLRHDDVEKVTIEKINIQEEK